MLFLLPIAERCRRDSGSRVLSSGNDPYSLSKPNSYRHQAATTTTTAPRAGSDGELEYKEARLKGSNQNDQPLLMGDSAIRFSPHSPIIVRGARGKKKKVDFDASAEQPVQKGMPGHFVVAGPAAFLSLSRGLSAVAKEYLRRATSFTMSSLLGTESESATIYRNLCFTFIKPQLKILLNLLKMVRINF
ncbi:hypothetical protein ACOSQ2_003344 [Xanthoceras sorbifolium]